MEKSGVVTAQWVLASSEEAAGVGMFVSGR